MQRLLSPLCLGLVLALPGCADMPELAAPPPPPGPAPQIVPLSGLVAAMPAPGQIVAADPGGLSGRAAALRARAAALRAQTIPAPPIADPQANQP